MAAKAVKAPVLGTQRKADLPGAVFGEEFHESLVHDAVRADLASRRRGTASTLSRGQVSMTTAKAWRQKGLGRARVGALSVPHRRGGGAAFGPKPRHYTVKINRKARRRALRAALSVHADRGSLAICDPATYETPSTKAAAEALGEFTGRVLVVVGADDATCAKSFRNIQGVSVHPADNVGVADVIGASRLIVTPTALEHLTGVAS